MRVNERKSILCLDCVMSIEQAVYDSADLGAVVAPESRMLQVVVVVVLLYQTQYALPFVYSHRSQSPFLSKPARRVLRRGVSKF